MAKNNPDIGLKKDSSAKKGKDEKKKQKLDSWAYWLAWIAFGSAVGAACVKLIKEWKPPDKDEYYK